MGHGITRQGETSDVMPAWEEVHPILAVSCCLKSYGLEAAHRAVRQQEAHWAKTQTEVTMVMIWWCLVQRCFRVCCPDSNFSESQCQPFSYYFQCVSVRESLLLCLVQATSPPCLCT